jgi:hypothetical protein
VRARAVGVRCERALFSASNHKLTVDQAFVTPCKFRVKSAQNPRKIRAKSRQSRCQEGVATRLSGAAARILETAILCREGDVYVAIFVQE